MSETAGGIETPLFDDSSVLGRSPSALFSRRVSKRNAEESLRDFQFVPKRVEERTKSVSTFLIFTADLTPSARFK